MIQRPRISFALVSTAGFSLILGKALSSSASVWDELLAVVIVFLGWLVFAAVIWLATVSAAHAVAGKSVAFSRNKLLVSAQLVASGVQVFTFLFPHAAASFAWESHSRLLNFLILAYVYAGPFLFGVGVLVSLWASIERNRYRNKTSVRIRVMHMQGNWPVWFDNEIMDQVDLAPISSELKRSGIALSQLFESSTVWDDESSRFKWVSSSARTAFNTASEEFARALASELGPKYFVETEVQRSKQRGVEFGREVVSTS